MKASAQDRWGVAAAAVVALASALVFMGLDRATVARVARAPVGGETGGVYAAEAEVLDNGGAKPWTAPSAQRRGPAWCYDVFTPPSFAYDPVTQRFTVVPTPAVPLAAASPAGGDARVSGIELIATRRPLYRLQLVGYVGSGAELRGVFQDLEKGGTRLARAGERWEKADVAIETLVLSRQRSRPTGSPHPPAWVATARVRDERSGEVLELNSRERCEARAPLAVIAVTGTASPRDVREGDEVQVGGVRYKIGPVQLAPPAVTLLGAGGDSADPAKPLRAVLYVQPTT